MFSFTYSIKKENGNVILSESDYGKLIDYHVNFNNQFINDIEEIKEENEKLKKENKELL